MGRARRARKRNRLLGRDRGVRLNLLRDDHQEVRLGWRYEALDTVGLDRLVGGSELADVVAEQILEVELALGVEVLELHLGALPEAALDHIAIEPQLVAGPHV